MRYMKISIDLNKCILISAPVNMKSSLAGVQQSYRVSAYDLTKNAELALKLLGSLEDFKRTKGFILAEGWSMTINMTANLKRETMKNNDV
jgi:hypothetical protein